MAPQRLIPSLLIIGERSYCSSFEDWRDRIIELQRLLPTYPTVALQIRNKTAQASSELRQILPLISPQEQIWLNGQVDDGRSFLRHLPEAQISQAGNYPYFASSIHSVKALKHAESHRPVFLQYGAIFPTAKPVTPFGLEKLHRICSLATVPILAVGGINSTEKIIDCKQQGAQGVSIGSWIMQAEDMKYRIEEIV